MIKDKDIMIDPESGPMDPLLFRALTQLPLCPSDRCGHYSMLYCFRDSTGLWRIHCGSLNCEYRFRDKELLDQNVVRMIQQGMRVALVGEIPNPRHEGVDWKYQEFDDSLLLHREELDGEDAVEMVRMNLTQLIETHREKLAADGLKLYYEPTTPEPVIAAAKQLCAEESVNVLLLVIDTTPESIYARQRGPWYAIYNPVMA